MGTTSACDPASIFACPHCGMRHLVYMRYLWYIQTRENNGEDALRCFWVFGYPGRTRARVFYITFRDVTTRDQVLRCYWLNYNEYKTIQNNKSDTYNDILKHFKHQSQCREWTEGPLSSATWRPILLCSLLAATASSAFLLARK